MEVVVIIMIMMQVKIIVLLKGNTLTVLPHLQKALTKDKIVDIG
jgi:hypothetical protein